MFMVPRLTGDGGHLFMVIARILYATLETCTWIAFEALEILDNFA